MDSTRYRILCVEDNADTCELIRLWLDLAPEDFEFVSLTDEREVIDAVKTESIDAIVMDHWLPDVAGVELCKSIRAFDKETPIMFYSGVADRESVENALKAGADHYLTKPAAGNAFMDALRSILHIEGRASEVHVT